MRDNSAVTLLGFLYDQLDMLATIDLSDESKVDAACRVNKAVNDTSRSIVGIADLSMRAWNLKPGTVSGDVVRGFFEGRG